MEETTAVVEATPKLGENRFAELEIRINQINTLMSKQMKAGRDYGIIPGCAKPSLWQPGAEKIKLLFDLTAKHVEIEDLSDDREVRFRVRCEVKTSSGRMLSGITAECSSLEEKYKWRAAVCDEEYEETVARDKRIKYGKKRGGGFWTQKQVAMNPYSQRNTILQMAQKRAFVASIKNAAGASEIFTVEGDDGGEQEPIKTHETKQPIKTPERTTSKKSKTSDVIPESVANELYTMIDGYGIPPIDVQQVLKENGATCVEDIPKSKHAVIKKKLSEMGQARRAQQ